MTRATPIISIGFSSRLKNLRLVSSLVRHAGILAGLDETGRRDLESAVAEAVGNCIRHTYGGREDRSIQLDVVLEDEIRLVVTVSDFGPACSIDLERWQNAPPAGPPNKEERSFFAICSLMDEVEHESDAAGNRLRMVKLLARAPVAAPQPILESFRAAS